MSQFKKYLEIIQEMKTEMKGDEIISIIYDKNGEVQEKINSFIQNLIYHFRSEMNLEYVSKQTPVTIKNAVKSINDIIQNKINEKEVLDIRNTFVRLVSKTSPVTATKIKEEMQNDKNHEYVVKLCDAIIGSLTGNINELLKKYGVSRLMGQEIDFSEKSINKIKSILSK